MLRNLPNEAYNRLNNRDKDFHIRNFILKYRDLVDINSATNDKERYLNLLREIGNSLSGVDFNRDILFICNRNINREVFLYGVSQFKEFVSYYYCNVLELSDIWWQHVDNDNDRNALYSVQEIGQRLLLLYSSDDMFLATVDREVNSVIESRSNGLMRDSSKREKNLTWMFFCGTIEQMRNARGYDGILNYFTRSEDKLVIDLNNKVRFANNVVSKSNKSDLGDIY